MGIKIIFLLFIFYSFLGWLMEVTCKLIQYKRFINRGFLMGPICPIYGHGAIIMLILLKDFASNPFILFVMSMLVCTTLEYLTSYFMEKLFSAGGKSESFRLRFVLFTAVRSADFPLFPSSPARFFRVLGQNWVRENFEITKQKLSSVCPI